MFGFAGLFEKLVNHAKHSKQFFLSHKQIQTPLYAPHMIVHIWVQHANLVQDNEEYTVVSFLLLQWTRNSLLPIKVHP